MSRNKPNPLTTPDHFRRRRGRRVTGMTTKRLLIGTALVLSLSACLGGETSETTRANFKPAGTGIGEGKGFFSKLVKPKDGEATRNVGLGENIGIDDPTKPKSALAGGVGTKDQSIILDALLSRQSILKSSSSYGEVASAVLAANARAAEADLRAAKLRNAAASKNWLPTIGPAMSLNSLGEVITGLIVDQVLFDNGRKKAERAFAKADVEVAAVVLAEDSNNRVSTALELYIRAEEGREQARAGADVEARMSEFARIMERRVAGGLSDPSDLQVTRQKLAQISNNKSSDGEAARTAIAELNAMSIRPLDGVRGIASVGASNASVKPLSVIRAEAERERDIAQAVIDRAAFLPGVSASGNVLNGGSSVGLDVTSETGFGFGTKANLEAVKATRQAAGLRVDQAAEDQNRILRRLEQELVSLKRQHAQGEGLLNSANANLNLFDRQYKAGLRPVMDVVRVYETKASTERQQIGLKYDIARTELRIAQELGALVDGEDI